MTGRPPISPVRVFLAIALFLMWSWVGYIIIGWLGFLFVVILHMFLAATGALSHLRRPSQAPLDENELAAAQKRIEEIYPPVPDSKTNES